MIRSKKSAALREELHKFIDDIVLTASSPEYWPLSHEEQIAFIRKAIFTARKISKSESYLADAILVAARRVRRHDYSLPTTPDKARL